MTTLDSTTIQTIPEVMATLEALSNDEVAAGFERATATTVRGLIGMAAHLRVMEERHMDTSGLQGWCMPLIRKIAYGQVLPEMVMKFQGRETLLARMANLPIPDQKAIIENEPMKVVEIVNGTPDVRHVPIQAMSTRQVQQVFGQGRIRSEAEQVAWLRSKEEQSPRVDSLGITYNKRKGFVTIHGTVIPKHILQFLDKNPSMIREALDRLR